MVWVESSRIPHDNYLRTQETAKGTPRTSVWWCEGTWTMVKCVFEIEAGKSFTLLFLCIVVRVIPLQASPNLKLRHRPTLPSWTDSSRQPRDVNIQVIYRPLPTWIKNNVPTLEHPLTVTRWCSHAIKRTAYQTVG